MAERLIALSISTILLVLALSQLRSALVMLMRHELIWLRNRLFVEWAKLHLSFDTPAYVNLRWSMNTAIRFTHKVSPLRLFPFYVLAKLVDEGPDDPIAKFRSSLKKVKDPRAHAILVNFERRENLYIGRFFLFASISGLMLFGYFVLSVTLRELSKHVRAQLWQDVREKLSRTTPIHYGRRTQTLAFKEGIAA